MFKRSVMFVVMLLTISVFLFASTTVELWSWRTQDAGVWEEVEKRLKEEGKDINIDFRAFLPTEYDAKVQLALQGGKGPDLMYTRRLPSSSVEGMINADLLKPLDNLVDFKDFNKNILKSVTYDGKEYGVPFAVQVVGIFYNKDIFDMFGIKEPDTWDELVEVAEKIKANGIDPFFVPGKEAWALTMQHAMCGVSVLGPDFIGALERGEADFLDPKWIDLNTKLWELKKYYQNGFVGNDTNDMNAAFAFGQAAMTFYGIWGVQMWRELNPDINVGYFMVPPISKDDEAYSYVYMDGAIGLTSNADQEAAAVEVLKFAARPEFGTIFSGITLNIPAVSNATMPDDPILTEVMEAAGHVSPYLYWVGSVFTTGNPSLYGGILSPGMQELNADKITPLEFAQKAQDGMSQWFTPLRKRLGLE